METMRKQKEKRNWKKTLAYVLPFLIGGVIGVLWGMIMVKSEEGKEASSNGYVFYAVILEMLASIFFHVVIHEAGHLIFGLMSGYRFVSFRIGSFTLVHTNQQWRIKRFSIPGTGGQCLMAPPKMDEQGNYPARLYNLGGILMNLVFSVLFTILAIVCRENEIWRSIWISFAGMGYVMFLSNGIPAKISGIANDGYNLFSIDKDPVGKRCFYLQLDLNARLSDGERLKDLPPEMVMVPEAADLVNPLISSAKLFEYYWYADRHEFDEAGEIMKQFDAVWDKMIPLLRNMIAVERIYLAIIGQESQDTIDSLLTKEVRTYLKNAKYDVHAKRVSYGLELAEDASSAKTKKAKEQFLKVVKISPVCGEAQMSKELADYMEQTMVNEMIPEPKGQLS